MDSQITFTVTLKNDTEYEMCDYYDCGQLAGFHVHIGGAFAEEFANAHYCPKHREEGTESFIGLHTDISMRKVTTA